MREVAKALFIVVLLGTIVLLTGAPVHAATSADGFVWFGAAPASGAIVEVINQSTGRVVWRGKANRWNPSFPSYNNYYQTPYLPTGRYSVRGIYNGRSKTLCCFVTNGSSWPNGFFVRMIVMIPG